MTKLAKKRTEKLGQLNDGSHLKKQIRIKDLDQLSTILDKQMNKIIKVSDIVGADNSPFKKSTFSSQSPLRSQFNGQGSKFKARRIPNLNGGSEYKSTL